MVGYFWWLCFRVLERVASEFGEAVASTSASQVTKMNEGVEVMKAEGSGSVEAVDDAMVEVRKYVDEMMRVGRKIVGGEDHVQELIKIGTSTFAEMKEASLELFTAVDGFNTALTLRTHDGDEAKSAINKIIVRETATAGREAAAEQREDATTMREETVVEKLSQMEGLEERWARRRQTSCSVPKVVAAPVGDGSKPKRSLLGRHFPTTGATAVECEVMLMLSLFLCVILSICYY